MKKSYLGGKQMKFKKITALSMALALCAGITVNAATSLPPTENSNMEQTKVEQKGEHEKCKKKRHHGGLYRTAKEIGITRGELRDAKENGKNFFELAKKKGYNEQQVKDIMIKNKTEALDKWVEKGKITKEEAKEMKEKIKERILKWDGSFKKPEEIKKENKQE
jgi:hypothetical protein